VEEEEEERRDNQAPLPLPTDETVPTKKRPKRAGGRFLRLPNWNLVASSSSGTTTLSEYLPNMEVDTLLGWATHTTHAGRPSAARPLPNPLLDLPSTPLRSGELYLIHQAMVDFILAAGGSFNDSPANLLYRQFDQSALVSLGICLEEMMTASLLPLACAHVRRCRALEEEEEQQEGTNDDGAAREDVLTAWTLPPEEAILKLSPPPPNDDDKQAIMDPISLRLPTSRVPALSHFSLIKPTVFRSSPPVEARRAVETWRHAHTIEADYFSKNRETYAMLVGCSTTSTCSSSAPLPAPPPP
jgi:hypothetical protein